MLPSAPGPDRDNRFMFERFEESARLVLVTAQEAARALRHAAIGVEHLLFGIADQDPVLLGIGPDAIRSEVVARLGTGQEPSPSSMPLTPAATAVLELGVEEAAYRGHERVRPAHLLLVLLREDDGIRSMVESLGKSIEEVTELAGAASARSPSSRPADIHEALREGHPVTVTLGDGLPIGDLGHPHTDAQVLLAMLVANGQAGKLLRNHGLDEQAVRRLHPRA